MHCSGTSCLTGSLERCGLFLGDVVRQSRHNIRGNHELRVVKRLHKQILAANGGIWYHPPERITVVTNTQKQGIREIVGRLRQNQPCGFKDPRLLLLLNLWLEVLDSYTLVGTFRHPVAVAKSLARRHQMLEEEAYELWLRYNAELIRWHRIHHFPLIEFNLSDIEAYRKTIVSLAITLGLKPDIPQLTEFISPELVHYCSPGSSIPDSCREMYAYLQQHHY
jgi:hypothetical protein